MVNNVQFMDLQISIVLEGAKIMSFRNCSFCGGRGCIACEGERKKSERLKTQRILSWSPPSEDDIVGMMRIARAIYPDANDLPDDVLRSIVSSPTPLMVINGTNDMAMASQFIGANALKAMSEQSGGDPEKFRHAFVLAAEKFRLQQQIEAQENEKKAGAYN